MAMAVRTALSTGEAVAHLTDEPAEVVLADTALTRPDSAEFTRRVLAAAPGAALVLFGPEEPRSAAAAVAAGARGVIRGDNADAVTLVTKALLLLIGQPGAGPLDSVERGPTRPAPRVLPAGGPVISSRLAAPRANPPLTQQVVPVPQQRSDLPSTVEPNHQPDAGGNPADAARAGLPRRRVDLTERELQVLRGMAEGKSNAEIGRELFVSEDTVKTHARRLFRKLGARDRAHAVASAFRAGLVT
jgi:DNA-binding NarL/FixJ family response regulator